MSHMTKHEEVDLLKFENKELNKTHCKWGHEFNKENIYVLKNGRACRKCRKRLDDISRAKRISKAREP